MSVRFPEMALLLDRLPLGLAVWRLDDEQRDETLTLIGLNSRAEAAFTVPAQNLLGKRIDEVLPRAREQGIPARIAEVARTGQTFDFGEMPYGDDHIRLGMFKATTFSVGPMTAAVIFDEVTEQTTNPAPLSGEARVRPFLSALPDAMFRIRRDGVVLDCYVSRPEILYVEPGEFLGKTVAETLPPRTSALIMARLRRSLRKISKERFEFELDVPRGTRHFEAQLVPISADEVVAVVRDDTERSKRMSRANERLRHLGRRLVRAQETERRIIGRELHDQIGQSLTGLKMMLERAGGEPQGAAVAVVQELITQVRDLSTLLRPAALDDLGLLPAIEDLVERLSANADVTIDVRTSGFERRLHPDVETAAFRLVQEALTNVLRHARATRVEMALACQAAKLSIEVDDDGSGFDSATLRGAGLSGMRERVRLLGGTFRIQSSPGIGTTIRAEIPIVGAAS